MKWIGTDIRGTIMPICPGCERKIPYDQLDLHERYCGEIRGGTGQRSLERLDERLTTLESRLEEGLQELEPGGEPRLSDEVESRINPRD